MTERKITIYSTIDGKCEKFTSVKTWGELKTLLYEDGHELENVQAAESINRTTLEDSEAKLPEVDFTIFMRPIETKGGSYSLHEFLIEFEKFIKEKIEKIENAEEFVDEENDEESVDEENDEESVDEESINLSKDKVNQFFKNWGTD